ncbi:MAG TPA: hypothetical protein VGR07_08585, partial [Thermoanaerobaculia bacterium]|nr:hypothetical protein [Thermoanaerobaculia bacterium]
MWTDPLLRALGADPAVFRPVYRVHKLMLRRRARLVRRRGKGASSFLLLGFTSLIWGLLAIGSVMSGTALLGGGLALTFGSTFLLMVVLTDDADALVHPAERLVLAAHPHDDRSLLLAKLAAIGRSLALLSALLFLPAGLTLLFVRGPGAGLAFLAGAAGAALEVAAGGLLFAVLLVRLWGRQKMERLLAWSQGAFWISYLLLGSGSSRLSSRL